MKLFQLYPKALAHLTCKSPWGRVFSTKMGALGRPGERVSTKTRRVETADFAD